MTATKSLSVAIVVTALLAVALFALLARGPAMGPDAIQFDRLAQNLAEGKGFSLADRAPYAPTMFREPGYPFFLSIIYRIFGHRPLAAIAAQALLHAATALLITIMARDLFGDAPGAWAGMSVAIFPTLANMAGYLLSETCFTFLLCACLYLYHRATRDGRVLWFAAAGVVCGVLSLTKAVAVPIPWLLAGITGMLLAARKIRLPRPWLACLVLIIIPTVMAGAWMLRNEALFHTASLTLRGGEALWARSEKLDDTPSEMAVTAYYSMSEYVGARLFPDAVDRPDRYLFVDFKKAELLRGRYRSEGMTDPDIEAIFQREAVRKILNNPLKYVLYTPVEWIKMTAFTYVPFLNEPSTSEWFAGQPGGRTVLSGIRGAFRLLAYPLLVLSVVGMMRHIRMWHVWVSLAFVIVYINGVYSLLDAIGRYAVPLIPLYCVFAAAAFTGARDGDRERERVGGDEDSGV